MFRPDTSVIDGHIEEIIQELEAWIHTKNKVNPVLQWKALKNRNEEELGKINAAYELCNVHIGVKQLELAELIIKKFGDKE